MSFERDEDPALKSNELIFSLEIARRLEAQARILPQKLDKNGYIYHVYAVLDALSSSVSMFKYLFEVYFSTNDSNLMYEFLSSPEGIATITSEMIFLITFSFLASLFENEESGTIEKNIALAWRYFREMMSGLRSAYKGLRSTIQIIGLLVEGMDLKYAMIPCGLILGVIAVANRWWLFDMREKRKEMIKKNNKCLFDILELPHLAKSDSEVFLSRISFQDDEVRIHAFFSMGLSGLIDGLSLFVGVLSLAILSSPALLAMTIISCIYVIACAISRLYEEYNDQLDLLITQNQCKLALVTREMQVNYAILLSLHKKMDKSSEDLAEIERLKAELRVLIKSFIELHQLVKTQVTHTYFTAALSGVRYGLLTYGVLTSFLFTTSTLFLVPAAIFPPALLIASIVMGCVLMIGFLAYSVIAHYLHLNKQKNNEVQPDIQLMDMQRIVEDCEEEDIFYESINEGLLLDPAPKFFFQEWSEVFRSLFTGLSKGNNVANFLEHLLQKADSQEHDYDVPLMKLFEISSIVLFGITLALRALARGFKEKPPVQIDLAAQTKPIKAEAPPPGAMKTEELRESCKIIQRPLDSPPPSSLSLQRFFRTPQYEPPDSSDIQPQLRM
ncbi:hypothetical protein [Legionella fallonii]|uniref:Transmembrane protein n=1 Tax=Legionella fallonii LLAP-10 TaxID=1212491 RepID=A0A098G4H4_9GAMM|nr:hypothetical protein [Legionella fallonii]CEG56871.1 conserved membrane protein of unknown function [coiled-coil] [Legionella fallonii LLAP-10]